LETKQPFESSENDYRSFKFRDKAHAKLVQNEYMQLKLRKLEHDRYESSKSQIQTR